MCCNKTASAWLNSNTYDTPFAEDSTAKKPILDSEEFAALYVLTALTASASHPHSVEGAAVINGVFPFKCDKKAETTRSNCSEDVDKGGYHFLHCLPSRYPKHNALNRAGYNLAQEAELQPVHTAGVFNSLKGAR